MNRTQFINRLSKNSNVNQAISNYLLWLEHYPGDYAGATEAAGDFIDTVEEVEELGACLKSLLQFDAEASLVAVAA